MSFRQIQRFLELVPELKAREALDASVIATFPHLTAEARRELSRDWRRLARIPIFAGYTRIPADQVEAWFRAHGGAR